MSRAFLLGLGGCGWLGSPPTSADADADTDADSDTDADTDSDTDTDTDADTDTDTDPVPWAVTAAEYDVRCEDSGVVPHLSVAVTGGRVEVAHTRAGTACCPHGPFVVRLAVSGSEVSVDYDLGKDDCDCVCGFDAAYAIEGLPAGSWTLSAGGESSSFVLP